MGMHETNYPEFVTTKIREISRRTELSEAEIVQEYEELFRDPFIHEDPQFTNDEERHRYAVAVLWTRYTTRPPVKPHETIPIGFSGLRLTRRGRTPMSNLFALVRYGGETKLKRIVLRNESASIYKKINLFCKYVVKLGEFSKGNDLIADNRSKFVDPVALKLTPAKVLERLNAKKVTIKDAKKFPSRVDSAGYVDSLDWRTVRGIIARSQQGERDDGTTYGVYTLSDSTVDTEPRVAPDGRVLRPGLTVWVAPELMLYENESEVDAVGTIQINKKTEEPSMNAYLIVPVHAREKTGGE